MGGEYDRRLNRGVAQLRWGSMPPPSTSYFILGETDVSHLT